MIMQSDNIRDSELYERQELLRGFWLHLHYLWHFCFKMLLNSSLSVKVNKKGLVFATAVDKNHLRGIM